MVTPDISPVRRYPVLLNFGEILVMIRAGIFYFVQFIQNKRWWFAVFQDFMKKYNFSSIVHSEKSLTRQIHVNLLNALESLMEKYKNTLLGA